MILAIDASRCRSGGAEQHLAGILKNLSIDEMSFSSVIVWIPKTFSEKLPTAEWLEIRHPKLLINNLVGELFWQAFSLTILLKKINASILLTADASSLCFFRPVIVISQDLSSFEPEVLKSAKGITKFRLQVIKWIQIYALRRAEFKIYQSEYAATLIDSDVDSNKKSAVIAHGVDNPNVKWDSKNFLKKDPKIHEYKCLYVSPFAHYKKQLELVKAVRICKKNGLDINLELIGGGYGEYANRVHREIKIAQQDGCKIFVKGFLNHDIVLDRMSKADIFLFPSTCETFGITLAEAMAIGIPIVCANASSLPDLLKDGGLYCDPACPDSIANCLFEVVNNHDETVKRTSIAKNIAERLSWDKASKDTFAIVNEFFSKQG